MDHFLRDRLNVPRIMGAKLPCEPDEAKVEESVISAADCSFEIDGDSGHVGTINGQPTQLGLLKYKESPVTRRECRVDTGRIVFEGTLAGFGDVKLTYCVSGDSLFCTVEAMAHDWRPDCATPIGRTASIWPIYCPTARSCSGTARVSSSQPSATSSSHPNE